MTVLLIPVAPTIHNSHILTVLLETIDAVNFDTRCMLILLHLHEISQLPKQRLCRFEHSTFGSFFFPRCCRPTGTWFHRNTVRNGIYYLHTRNI